MSQRVLPLFRLQKSLEKSFLSPKIKGGSYVRSFNTLQIFAREN